MNQWFSKGGPKTSNVSISWEVVKWVPATNSETLGVRSAIYVLIHHPGNTDTCESLRIHAVSRLKTLTSLFSFSFSAKCRIEACCCLIRLLPSIPSRKQSFIICLQVFSGDGTDVFCKSYMSFSLYCDSCSYVLSSFLSSLKTILSLCYIYCTQEESRRRAAI